MNIVRFTLLIIVTAIAGRSQIAVGQFSYEGTVDYRPYEVQLFGCDFSIDGTYLVTGGDSVRVFHAATGDLLQQMRPTLRPRGEPGSISLRHWFHELFKNQWTRRIAFSPVMKDVFATAGDDGVVRVWRVSNPKPLHTLKGHKGRITELAFSPNGQLLASGGSRHKRGDSIDQFRLWNVVSGELVESDSYYNDGVSSIAFLDDETVVFARNDDKLRRDSVIEFFDITSWSSVRTMRFTPGKAFHVSFTPQRDKLVIAGGECIPLGPNSCRPTGYLWIADMRARGPAQRVKTEPHGYFDFATMVDADRFVTETSLEQPGQVVDCLEMRRAADGKILWSTDCENGSGYGLVVSPDRKQLVYCTQKKIVFLNSESGEQIRTIHVTE